MRHLTHSLSGNRPPSAAWSRNGSNTYVSLLPSRPSPRAVPSNAILLPKRQALRVGSAAGNRCQPIGDKDRTSCGERGADDRSRPKSSAGRASCRRLFGGNHFGIEARGVFGATGQSVGASILGRRSSRLEHREGFLRIDWRAGVYVAGMVLPEDRGRAEGLDSRRPSARGSLGDDRLDHLGDPE